MKYRLNPKMQKNLIKKIVEAWNNGYNIRIDNTPYAVIIDYYKKGLHFTNYFEKNQKIKEN